VARDNPSSLFVAVFAGVLDLASGELDYCSAGQENPYLIRPATGEVQRLAGGGGPPLCAVDDFAYESSQTQLAPGEVLCVVSDGVTEAQNFARELYGGERAARVLGAADSAHTAVDSLREDVNAFAGDAEPADDMTVLALCWRGAATGR